MEMQRFKAFIPLQDEGFIVDDNDGEIIGDITPSSLLEIRIAEGRQGVERVSDEIVDALFVHHGALGE